MKQIFIIFSLMTYLATGLSLQAGSSIILRGENCDYLYDAKLADVWKGSRVFRVEKWREMVPGYYFACEDSIFRFSKDEITCSDSDWRLKVTDCLLPVPSSAKSIQEMVHDGRVYLPVRSGFLVVNLETHLETLLPYSWQLQFTADAGLEMPIPKLASQKESLWLLGSGCFKKQVSGDWKEMVAVPDEDRIDTYMFAGSRFVNLVLFKVTQGELSSFRTRVFSFSNVDGRLLMDREFGGILKNPGVDPQGRLVYEYVKASILSAFMGRNKVRLRIVDPGSGKVLTRSFSVGDKRRHLFFMERADGTLLIIVQCKNGNVFVIEPISGNFRKLKDVKLGYDYTLIRGVGNGVFYNEKTGNRVAVSFDPGPGGS
ncbi:MAG: hypothetical protein GXO70_01720 [Acidobacteria bacterium]|nr:hypothetical protein [Acidobacteriota bacterium]